MVLRYWGDRDLSPEDFAFLLSARASGIRSDALEAELSRRGWTTQAFRGDARAAKQHLERGRPLIALIEDRPGRFHYVVLLAWADGQVVLHDPARGPFRVVAEATFLTTWAATDSWTLLVLPDPDSVLHSTQRQVAGTSEAAMAVRPGDGCDALVSQGVGLAQAGDQGGADAALSNAVALCPASALATRELAGLRFVQSRWHEAAQLAGRAVAHAPGDAQAWRLLAASRFILDDLDGALHAWNRIGEPQIDLIRVDGLDRTYQAVVHELLGLAPRTELSLVALQRARRRLALLPAASATRLGYRPVAGRTCRSRGDCRRASAVPGSRGPRLPRRTCAARARTRDRYRRASQRRSAVGSRMALVARAAAPCLVPSRSGSVRAFGPVAAGRTSGNASRTMLAHPRVNRSCKRIADASP